MPFKTKSSVKFMRRSRRTLGLRKKKVTKVSKKLIRTIANKVVSRRLMDKEVRSSNSQGLFAYPGAALGLPPNIWSNNNILDTSVVYQGIAQNFGEGNRISNIIHPKKFTFSFMLAPNDNNVPSPIHIRMYVLTFKFDPNNSVAADIWGSMQNWSTTGGLNRSFFDNGNGTSGMAGDLTDLMKPINTNVWRVYKVKTFKIGVSATPTFGTTQYGNNDFKLSIRKTINLLPYIPKTIQYNDAEINSVNKKVFIVFECLRADGASNDVTTQYAKLYYNYNFKYENA